MSKETHRKAVLELLWVRLLFGLKPVVDSKVRSVRLG
jgi:hypothetical protein